jgi:hypothetical protein
MTTKKKKTAKKTTTTKKVSAKPKECDPVDLTVTQSELSTFLTCPRLWWYQYQAGEFGCGVDLSVSPDYFIEGELGHYALAKWYETGAKGQPLMLRQNMINRVNELIEEMGEIPVEQDNALRVKLAAMVGACHGYKQVRKPDFDMYDILFVEKEFEYEIDGVKLLGKVDLGLKERDTGTQGFMDHKFMQSIDRDAYSALPLTLQQMVYCLGFLSLTGKLPDWYIFNFVKKSQLRRKQPSKQRIGEESLMQYEARVQQQYVEEKEKMFFRPPPIPVEEQVFNRIKAQLEIIIGDWKAAHELDPKNLPLNFSSCSGKYGKLCAFGPACTAFLAGRSEQGWDSATCRGLYRSKETTYPELEGNK